MTRRELQSLKIVHYGHPALRQKAAPVRRVTAEVKALAKRMIELMQQARGVGLAANQVGVARRLAVVVADGEPAVLVDPELVSAQGGEKAEEGCLSLPRLYGDVERPGQVVIRARNLSGRRITFNAEGLLARTLCHELDHLDGDLFIDQVDESTLHWLVRPGGDEEPVVQPTGLDDALKFFLLATERERQ